MMGTLITPTIASSPLARAARRGSSIEANKDMKPILRNSRISSVVRRASHTHHVPHMGLPHNEPDHNARKVNSAPVRASAEAIIDDSRVLNTSPAHAKIAKTTKMNIDIHAAGTSM